MTTFKGPVNIGQGVGVPNVGGSFYTHIEASGSAVFKGPFIIGSAAASGAAQRYVTIDSSGTADFTGGLILEGPSNAQGRVQVTQIVTVAGTLALAAVANLRFPANSMLVDATFILQAGVSQASAGNSAADIMVGTSGAQAGYFRIPVSGAVGYFRVNPVNVCGALALNTGANGSEIYLTVNSQAGTAGADVSPLVGTLAIHYVRRA